MRTGGLKNFRTGGVTDLWRLLLLGGSVPQYVHNAMILVIFSVFSFFESYLVETRPTLGYLSGNSPTQLSVCNLSGTYF